jgi:hypothetical protein
MAEAFELLGESFSTADAEVPVLAYESGTLRVRFRDWREREVEIMFREMVAFSWDDGDAACSIDHRDDASYIVAGSTWLARHIAAGTVPQSGGHRHYKLCFNVVGVLQVIAESMEVRT